MKHTGKILTLLLLVCMLASMVLTACGGNGGSGTSASSSASSSSWSSSASSSGNGGATQGTQAPQGTTKPAQSAVVQGTSVNYDQKDPLLDAVPEGKYNGRKFYIFTWNYEQWQLDEVQTGDVILSEFYEHAKFVQERTGVDLELIEELDNWDNRINFRDALKTRILNETAPDLVCSYASTAVEIMLINLSANLLDNKAFPTLNGLQNAWWSQDLINNMKKNGGLYYITGEASVRLLDSIQCMVMNLDCIELNKVMDSVDNYDTPYEMVSDGAWTWDVFMEMTKGVYADTAKDNTPGKGDTYGFSVSSYIDYDQFPLSIGYRALTVEGSGYEVYGTDEGEYGNSNMSAFVSTIKDFVENNKGVEKSYSGYSGAQNCEFLAGNTCFATASMNFLRSEVYKQQFTYGVLPYPMLDAAQGEYYSSLSMYYTMYSIPENATDKVMSGAVLEIMGYNGLTQVSKVVFEECFKGRYDATGEDYAMYDILRSSLIFDPARLLKVTGFAIFRDVMKAGSDWTSTLGTTKTQAQTYLDKMMNGTAA